MFRFLQLTPNSFTTAANISASESSIKSDPRFPVPHEFKVERDARPVQSLRSLETQVPVQPTTPHTRITIRGQDGKALQKWPKVSL